MIDAVLVFAMINIAFEFVVLAMVSPRLRLRLLGSHSQQLLLHCSIFIIVIMVHWGTLVGTMASFLSFCLSLATVWCAQQLWGKVVGGRYYHRGLIAYSASDLK